MKETKEMVIFKTPKLVGKQQIKVPSSKKKSEMTYKTMKEKFI